MRVNRGTAVFGIMAASIIILTVVLAVSVYQGASSQNHVPDRATIPFFFRSVDDHPNDTDISTSSPELGATLGAGPTTILGGWQYPYGTDTVIFSSSTVTSNFDYDHQKQYTTHTENIGTGDGTSRRATIYSPKGDPWDGWAFIDGDLYSIGYQSFFGWLTSQKLTPMDPIIGKWRDAIGSRGSYGLYTSFFDGSHYILDEVGAPDDWHTADNYQKVDNVWVRFYYNEKRETNYDNSVYRDYNMTIYRTDTDRYGQGVTLMGFAFIDGTLYDIRSDSGNSYPYKTSPLYALVRY